MTDARRGAWRQWCAAELGHPEQDQSGRGIQPAIQRQRFGRRTVARADALRARLRVRSSVRDRFLDTPLAGGRVPRTGRLGGSAFATAQSDRNLVSMKAIVARIAGCGHPNGHEHPDPPCRSTLVQPYGCHGRCRLTTLRIRDGTSLDARMAPAGRRPNGILCFSRTIVTALTVSASRYPSACPDVTDALVQSAEHRLTATSYHSHLTSMR